MAKLLIVYATDYGNTKTLADTIAEGATSVAGTEVILKTAEEATGDDLAAADGILIGTPVHMGSMDWRVKKFIDTECSGQWMADGLIGKVGGVFATGSGYGNTGGGAELAMLSVLTNMAELGMIIVPLPKSTPGYPKGGLQWGPYGRSAGEQMEQTGVQPESLEAAKCHGIHLARAAAIIKENAVFR